MNPILDFFLRYWTAGLEIFVLWILVYGAYLYLRSSRGTRIFMVAVVILITLQLISQILDLRVIQVIFGSASAFIAFALIIIFQPELRRVASEIAAHPLFASPGRKIEIIDDITETVVELGHRRIGTLLAIQQESQLRSFAETGVALDAAFSKELILTIFFPRTALHDGGVILHNDRVVAAACIFPVSQQESLDRSLGLRHRAALGLTEATDAIVIVVSEETGQITLCHHNTLERNLKADTLRRRLSALLLNEHDPSTPA